jgi:hypothetical protein
LPGRIFAAQVKLKGGYSKDGRPNFSELFELARVIPRLAHIASRIVNANYSIM